MFERIDGIEYEIGSAAHAAAKAAQVEKAARHDEAYVEHHDELVDNHVRLIRKDDSPFSNELRKDANATMFIARDLVFVRAMIERTIYEQLRAPEFIPVEGGHPAGAESYSTRRVDRVGKAKITTDLAGDAPRVDVNVGEDLKKYVNVRASYAYTVQDLEKAAFAKTQLTREKALACAETIARGLEDIGRSGNVEAGLTGFFNNPLVTVLTLTNGEWPTATADEIVADFKELEQAIITASRDTQPAGGFRLVLPTTMEGRLATLQRSSTAEMTVKEYLLKNARIIKAIDRWIALDDAVSPDIKASDAPMGICYPKDIQTLFWPFAIQYDEQPPQLEGWEYVHQARARCGGVEVRRPTNMLYVENLD